MIRHVVMFTWREDASAERIAEIAPRLAKLPGLIPQIRRYEYGPGINPGNKDFVLVAEFDSNDDFAVYRDHPDHQAFIADCIVPTVAERSAVQYVV
ncbi:Dabb family protein [Actinocorallia lasiicapitis]